MRQKAASVILMLLAATAAFELYAEWNGLHLYMFYSKPWILPLMGFYFFAAAENLPVRIQILMGLTLFFAWLGDISLMLTPRDAADLEIAGISKNKYFFLSGLTAFLLRHLFIFPVFRYGSDPSVPSHFKRKPWHFLPLLLYFLIMSALIGQAVFQNPEKRIATVPVIIYSAVLVTMVALALNRKGRVSQKSFRLTFAGALLFLFSDSLIGVNFLMLENTIPHAGFFIFITYLPAEFLILRGIISQYSPTNA